MSWDANFAGLPPIELPDGRKLETLSDCRSYILALPKAEQSRCEPVVAELLKAAEHGGPFCFIARVAFANVLYGRSGVGPAPVPRDKGAAWKVKRAKRKPTRDPR